MAARKKATKTGRSKSVGTKTVTSRKRAKPAKRAKPKKAAKKAAGSVKASAPKVVASRKRPAPLTSRKSATTVKLAAKAAKPATKSKKPAKSAERREDAQRKGKITPTDGAKKTLTLAVTGLAVDDTSNGKVVDARLQTKSPQKVKTQVASEESKLKVEKSSAATVPGAKAMEVNPAVDAAMTPKTAAPASAKQKPVAKEEPSAASKSAKPTSQRQGFKLNEFVVYPAHGVGQIVAIEEQEVVGFKLELFVISFSKDKMTLRVPTSKVAGVGMRKISDPDTAKRSLDILSGRARIKRTMWSRRAQEYETKINSGDIAAIAEVVRDLYRSEAQPEQSYSERQLYEAALDRMVREIAAVQKSNEIDALKAIETQLQKTHNRPPKSAEVADPEIEEAA
jgi:CarD family transcriptional regulator